MSEQAPQLDQKSEEYLQDYPEAITDQAKASDMAYASKSNEEKVVRFANDAVRYEGAAMHLAEVDDTTREEVKEYQKELDQLSARQLVPSAKKWTSEEAAQSLAYERIGEAQAFRGYADREAQVASEEYDKRNSIIASEADALKKGKKKSFFLRPLP